MSLRADDLRDALVRSLGDPRRVADGDSERDLHAGDFSFHRPHRPEVVVYASRPTTSSRCSGSRTSTGSR